MNTDAEFQSCAERLKALADPSRLRIVLCLFGGMKNVSQISDLLGDDMVKVSHHLGVLRHAEIVTTQRKGRYVNYELHPSVALQTTIEGNRFIELGCCRVDLSEKKVK
jgi:DNA-binding transcriptional ArsR family regulator